MVEEGFISEYSEFTDNLPTLLRNHNISFERQMSELQAPKRLRKLQTVLKTPLPLGWFELDDFFDNSNLRGKCSVNQDLVTKFWTEFASVTRKYVKSQQKF